MSSTPKNPEGVNPAAVQLFHCQFHAFHSPQLLQAAALHNKQTQQGELAGVAMSTRSADEVVAPVDEAVTAESATLDTGATIQQADGKH
jgi:hypothetical protein